MTNVGIIIENSSVVGNTAVGSSGGIFVQSDSTLRVTRSIVVGNRAVERGGESATFCV